jgi:hypothetical protein
LLYLQPLVNVNFKKNCGYTKRCALLKNEKFELKKNKKIMKKIVLFAMFLITSSIYSQQNNEYLKLLKELKITSPAAKKLVTKKLNEMKTETTDSTFLASIDLYLAEIDTIEFKMVDIKKIDKSVLKKYRVKTDKFQKTTFIKTRTVFDRNFYIYIGINDNAIFLRTVSIYGDLNWIFMEKAILLIDDDTYEYSLGKVKRDVNGRYVKERSDVIVDDDLLVKLRNITESSEVSIRLKGKKIKDKRLSKKTKMGIIQIIDLYDKLLETSK